MRVFTKKNVLEAALDRTRYIFDEFDDIVIGMSGGKDSTVVMELALIIAREKGLLPLKVMWLDQEAEWQGTVDYIRRLKDRKEIELRWYQIPMVITNNASSYERYQKCWDEEHPEDWIHPKDDIAIKENIYGTERFFELFGAIMREDFPPNSAKLAGVRAEESPRRAMGLSELVTYKHVTWGKKENPDLNQFVFYPIYDWSYTDVWKFINENHIDYNEVYDGLYRYGQPVRAMRVSNLHHETAIQGLLLVQEIEPQTWAKVAKRIEGANTIKHIKRGSFRCPEELPKAFKSWQEYALYLSEKIIQEDIRKLQLYKRMERMDKIFVDEPIKSRYYRAVINTILSSDWDFTKLTNWDKSLEVYSYAIARKGQYRSYMLKHDKYFTDKMRAELLERIDNGRVEKGTDKVPITA